MGACCGWGGEFAFVVCFLTVYGADVRFCRVFLRMLQKSLAARCQGSGYRVWGLESAYGLGIRV